MPPTVCPKATQLSAPRDELFRAIKGSAIFRSSEETLISKTGHFNDWLIDMRGLFMQAKFLTIAADLFWMRFHQRLPFQVAGLEAASIPIVSAILVQSLARGTPITGFMVRKERKTYGRGNQIEGSISDDPIVIIDDVVNSGSALELIRVILEGDGRSVSSVFTLIDYRSLKGLRWRAKNNVEIVSEFVLDEFGMGANRPVSLKPARIFQSVWRFVSPKASFFHLVPKSFPTTDGERVYFGTDVGVFWCLDAASGEALWGFNAESNGRKGIWSAPTLNQGRVYFGAYNGNVYCLDAVSGKEIWRFTEAEWVGSSPALAPELGLLFIGLEFSIEVERGSIAALDIETGEKLWEHRTKRYTHASPAYSPTLQLVACGSNDNELFLFSAKTGELRWRFETQREEGEKGSIRHAPAFDETRNQVITGCANGRVYIVDINTGCEAWSVQTGGTIYTIPLVVGDLVYIGSTDKYFYVLDLIGRTVAKKIYIGSKIFCPPREICGRVYFGACNGVLYEFDPLTFELTGTHQLNNSITNAVAYSDRTNLFYVLTYMNELYALSYLETDAASMGVSEQ